MSGNINFREENVDYFPKLRVQILARAPRSPQLEYLDLIPTTEASGICVHLCLGEGFFLQLLQYLQTS